MFTELSDEEMMVVDGGISAWNVICATFIEVDTCLTAIGAFVTGAAAIVGAPVTAIVIGAIATGVALEETVRWSVESI